MFLCSQSAACQLRALTSKAQAQLQISLDIGHMGKALVRSPADWARGSAGRIMHASTETPRTSLSER